jgi:hypothetical protein
MSAVMTANGQSRNQKHKPHKHGTTTTRIGNQLIGFFNEVLFFMFATWPNYLPNAKTHWGRAIGPPTGNRAASRRPVK